jgi:tryptophan halogenase
MEAAMDRPIQALQHIAVVGRGLVAWGAAVTLAELLKKAGVSITLVALSGDESPEALVEVGQPALLTWLDMIGLNEAEVLARCGGLYCLGLEYQQAPGNFFLPYGRHGISAAPATFEHEFFRAYPTDQQSRFNEHFLATQMARRHRFDFPVDDPRSVKSTLRYGARLDAGALCAVLQDRARALGVEIVHCENIRAEVNTKQDIERLHLSDGGIVQADFYMDATGPTSRLLGEALAVPFREETRTTLWPTRLSARLPGKPSWQPFASIRREAGGWMRSSTLQQQTVVELWTSEQACEEQQNPTFEAMTGAASVQLVKERYGLRESPWQQNCLALGRAAGHPGDLLASEWHRACQALLLWLELYPDRSNRSALSAEFNRRERARYDGWLELHELHNIDLMHDLDRCSEPLRWRLQMFNAFGRLWPCDEQLLNHEAWIALLLGLGWRAAHGDILLDSVSAESIQQKHQKIYATLVAAAERMPTLEQVVRHHCLAVAN